MEYKMIKKKGKINTRIEAKIPCIFLTPNRYNALAPAIVYVSNDVLISVNSATSQMNTIATQEALLLWAEQNRTEHIFIW